MQVFTLLLLAFLPHLATADKYDCSRYKQPPIVDQQKAHIFVGRFYWQQTANGREEKNETVCSTEKPVLIDVQDIRGHEEEWFYCNRAEFALSCETKFRGEPAKILVRPAVVLRNFSHGTVRDSHFHAYLLPKTDPLKYHDFFARVLSRDLQPQEIILDTAGGGRGEESETDSFYIRVDFLK